jgi:glyoxylase-like metal-dependent hydrolase (beta-lactamase superfamily II)
MSTSPEKDTDNTKAKLAEARSYLDALTAVKPRPPTRTFSDAMTLRIGGRELRILWLGRGHTGGDVVVYLPAEKILCTGDLYNGSVGFLKDAYVDEWADTLDALAKIDADRMIAGHGPVLKKDPAQIAIVRDCFTEMARQAAAFEAAGVTPEAAASQIDLTRFAGKLPQYKNKGLAVASVSRMYEVIRERRARRAAGAANAER